MVADLSVERVVGTVVVEVAVALLGTRAVAVDVARSEGDAVAAVEIAQIAGVPPWMRAAAAVEIDLAPVR